VRVREALDTEVCVVGAGLAGLTAAHRLLDAGHEVAVVEARDRVGGRTHTTTLADGTVVDLGGQWIGPTQDRVRRLVDELGLATFPTWIAGESLIGLGSDLVRYRGEVPKVPRVVLADVAQAQLRLDRVARTVPLERPWEAERARRLDAETFETWIRRTARTERGRDFFRVISEAVFASEASSISMLHVAFYVRSGRGVDMLVGTRGGAQQDRVVGGAQQLSDRLAEALGDRVHLATPVRRVDHGEMAGAGVRVHADGLEVTARRAVVAVPPTLAGRIDYRPALPGDRDQLTQRMPAGSVIKAMAVYQAPFWRADGLSGQVATSVPPVKVVYDNSPPSGTPGVLLAFVEGRSAVELGRATPGEVRAEVLSALVRYFGPRAAAPSEFVFVDWAREEWSRGCYGAHLPPGALTQFGPALRRPVGPIHWAGTETAEGWSGYMDGAIESGERAAREIHVALDRAGGAGPRDRSARRTSG
jgi:monoamine oxidase